MLFNREISSKIESLAQNFPCVVVTGARQVGKTTLLKSLYPNHNYISLDLPSLAEEAENNPESFFEKHPAPLLIDEVQYAPAVFRYLKIAIDQQRHQMGQFILTGSQKFVLMKEVSESLAGRAAIVDMENLSLKDLGPSKSNHWNSILAKGFYPELWRNPKLKAQDFYSSYLATYLERDVRQILNVSSLRDFERFIRSCAARSAQILNYSDLARDIGIKPETARQWIAVLEASNQVTLLEPYFANVGKRIAKSPKIYWNDPGFMSFLMGLDETTIDKSPMIGALWETLVFAELRKQKQIASSPSTLWFYRDAQGVEVDFLKIGGAQIHLLEAKWTENPNERWFHNLTKVAEVLKKDRTQNQGELILVCRSSHSYVKENVKVLNPYEL